MKIFPCVILAALLLGCGKPRPLTMEEQEAWMVKQQCEREATNASFGWPDPDNPEWASYFVMCMRNMGVSDAVLYRMWW